MGAVVDNDQRIAQREIIEALRVDAHFDVAHEIAHRLAFIAGELQAAGKQALVLGISGGVDSLIAGRLCQLAVEHLRANGHQVRFLAMRLPYGEQRDSTDAEAALKFIRPDETLRIDIQSAVDATMKTLTEVGIVPEDVHAADFIAGNVRARQRMIVQYAVANSVGGIVVGTDHAAEAVMGFFTKHGDGACDIAPLSGLTKRRVRAMAQHLGAPEFLVNKVPTADLEILRPLHPDEAALGVRYDTIDEFLTGQPISQEDAAKIIAMYRKTEHKRSGPQSPNAFGSSGV